MLLECVEGQARLCDEISPPTSPVILSLGRSRRPHLELRTDHLLCQQRQWDRSHALEGGITGCTVQVLQLKISTIFVAFEVMTTSPNGLVWLSHCSHTCRRTSGALCVTSLSRLCYGR